MYVDDHNRFIKGIFSQIREEGLNEDLIHSLCIELKFAHMNNIDYRGAPVYLERDGKMYLILYTSFDEFQRHFPDWAHSHMSFDWYLKVLNSPVYFHMEGEKMKPCDELKAGDGIIFDMEGDAFILEGELLNRIWKFFAMNIYSPEELTEIFNSYDNGLLEDLLKKSPHDWDEIIREIGNSIIFYLMGLTDSDAELDFTSLFNIFADNPFGYGKNELIVSTANDLGNQFAVIVNFKNAVDYVLSFGIAGLTVKTSTGEVFMSRELLVEKYEMIEMYCDDEKLNAAYQWLFELWE